MSLDVASIGTPNLQVPPDGTPRAARAAAGPAGEDTLALASGEVPASPPPEVLEAMEAAGRAARELERQGRELRFANGEEGLRIELRGRDGSILRTLRPSEVLDLAAGARLD